jgi:hypothetical protein
VQECGQGIENKRTRAKEQLREDRGKGKECRKGAESGVLRGHFCDQQFIKKVVQYEYGQGHENNHREPYIVPVHIREREAEDYGQQQKIRYVRTVHLAAFEAVNVRNKEVGLAEGNNGAQKHVIGEVENVEECRDRRGNQADKVDPGRSHDHQPSRNRFPRRDCMKLSTRPYAAPWAPGVGCYTEQ